MNALSCSIYVPTLLKTLLMTMAQLLLLWPVQRAEIERSRDQLFSCSSDHVTLLYNSNCYSPIWMSWGLIYQISTHLIMSLCGHISRCKSITSYHGNCTKRHAMPCARWNWGRGFRDGASTGVLAGAQTRRDARAGARAECVIHTWICLELITEQLLVDI